MVEPLRAVVVSVSSDREHRFSNVPRENIALVEGLGVEADAHLGKTIQHRSRVAVDATQANLRQVHLIHSELFEEFAADGFSLRPGDMGENVTTVGIDLLGLPQGAVLHLGDEAVVQITGLRNPCAQINSFKPGLLRSVLGRDDDGQVIRRAGIMGVVLKSGMVHPGDTITVNLPEEPHQALERV